MNDDQEIEDGYLEPYRETGSNQHRRRKAACTGKVKYVLSAYAEATIKEIAEREGKPDPTLKVYFCQHCGYFHLGHLEYGPSPLKPLFGEALRYLAIASVLYPSPRTSLASPAAPETH